LRALRTLRQISKPSKHNGCNSMSCCTCMASVGLQCTKWRHSKLLICLFFCEKSIAAEKRRHTFWTRDTFSYTQRKRQIQFVQCRPTNTTTNHFTTSSSPAKFDCIAQLGWTVNGSNRIDARNCHNQVK